MPASPTPEPILIFVTCASAAEADRIATALLERHLVACASAGTAVRSRYWWQGRIATAEETPLLLKALRADFAAIAEEIRRLHSYAVPEILAVAAAEASAPYLAWLAGECHRPAQP